MYLWEKAVQYQNQIDKEKRDNTAVKSYRGDTVENSHRANIAVVDETGALKYYFGDPFQIVIGRSALKPIQALPVIETGAADHYQLEEADLALFCASHNGEKRHVDRVKKILEQAEIPEEKITIGEHPYTFRMKEYIELVKQGIETTPLYHCCSGKHAGKLVTAKFMGESLDGYLEITHPVQKRILDTISEMAEYPKEKIALSIDGCGAPVHGMPLIHLAYLYGRMTTGYGLGPKRRKAVERIIKAMIKYPEMVAGERRFCTDFMRAGKGQFFGKVGADGVYLAGDLKHKLGFAIKMEDGNDHLCYLVLLETLRQLDLCGEDFLKELSFYYEENILNVNGEKIGQSKPCFTLNKAE